MPFWNYVFNDLFDLPSILSTKEEMKRNLDRKEQYYKDQLKKIEEERAYLESNEIDEQKNQDVIYHVEQYSNINGNEWSRSETNRDGTKTVVKIHNGNVLEEKTDEDGNVNKTYTGKESIGWFDSQWTKQFSLIENNDEDE